MKPSISISAKHRTRLRLLASAKVAELRKEHRIADLALIVEVPIMVDDDEARGASTLYLGGYENRLPMLAHEYGKQKKDYEDMLAKVIAGGRLSR